MTGWLAGSRETHWPPASRRSTQGTDFWWSVHSHSQRAAQLTNERQTPRSWLVSAAAVAWDSPVDTPLYTQAAEAAGTLGLGWVQWQSTQPGLSLFPDHLLLRALLLAVQSQCRQWAGTQQAGGWDRAMVSWRFTDPHRPGQGIPPAYESVHQVSSITITMYGAK